MAPAAETPEGGAPPALPATAAVPAVPPAKDPGGDRTLDDLVRQPEFLGRVASLIDELPEVKSTHGLALLVGLRQCIAQGRRPVTCGEAREFLGRARQLSPAGARKIVRKLVEQGHAVPVPNPCIDKAVDLHAGPRLARLLPVIAKPYTLYRVSKDVSVVPAPFFSRFPDRPRLTATARADGWRRRSRRIGAWQARARTAGAAGVGARHARRRLSGNCFSRVRR